MALDLNDKTSNANNLTNGNTVADVTTGLPSVTGITHAAGFTAASSQYLQLTNTSASLSMANAVTIEANVKFTSLPTSTNQYEIFANWYDTENHYLLYLLNTAGVYSLHWLVSNGTTSEPLVYNWTVSTATWYHVAATWQGSDKTFEIVIDGTSAATFTGATVVSMPTNARKPAIGANNLNPPSGDFTDSTMTDVRIWNIKRTQAQISAARGATLLGTESGLVAYWPFGALPVVGGFKPFRNLMGVGI